VAAATTTPSAGDDFDRGMAPGVHRGVRVNDATLRHLELTMSNFSTILLDQLTLVHGGQVTGTPTPTQPKPDIYNNGAGPVRREYEASGEFTSPVGVRVQAGGAVRTTDTKETECLALANSNGLLKGPGALDAIKACMGQ
jgi:hypothetical protein